MGNEALSLLDNTSVDPTNAEFRGSFANAYLDLAQSRATLAGDQAALVVARGETYTLPQAVISSHRGVGSAASKEAPET